MRWVAHKPGGGGAAQAKGPACEQKGRGGALSALPPACVQRRWRACSWSGVQPGQRGLLPANEKEGGWSTLPPAPPACVQRGGQGGRGTAGQGQGGVGDRARAGEGCALPLLRPHMLKRVRARERGAPDKRGDAKGVTT